MRRQNSEKVFCQFVTVVAGHDDFRNFFGVNIAQGPLNQVALFVNKRRSLGLQRIKPDLVPGTDEVIVVAYDVGFGFFLAGRTDDYRHIRGQRQFLDDSF